MSIVICQWAIWDNLLSIIYSPLIWLQFQGSRTSQMKKIENKVGSWDLPWAIWSKSVWEWAVGHFIQYLSFELKDRFTNWASSKNEKPQKKFSEKKNVGPKCCAWVHFFQSPKNWSSMAVMASCCGIVSLLSCVYSTFLANITLGY